jgi:hypothetical protein
MVCRCRFFHSQTFCAMTVAMTASLVAWPAHARTADDPARVERQTLEAALLLAGIATAKLPVSLASVKPDTASAGVQAWTTVGGDGRGERIYIYSGSDLFRCARPSNENYQCLLKLASVILHEAWHFRHGASETGAYDAQLAFLMANQGALEQMTDVRRSRSQAVAAERKAVEAARKLSSRQAQ